MFKPAACEQQPLWASLQKKEWGVSRKNKIHLVINYSSKTTHHINASKQADKYYFSLSFFYVF